MQCHVRAEASNKMADGQVDTRRIVPKKQTVNEAYAEPGDTLEIDVCDAQVHGFAKNRYTDYEVKTKVRMGFLLGAAHFAVRLCSADRCECSFDSAQTNIPVFRAQEASVRRRYSDFEWLKKELERDSKVCSHPCPSCMLSC